ncbi:MAG: hypothetical protein SPJ65_08655 [Roseburia sp.]|nr:hypothetical protein [Roseburia sp.]
MKNKWKKMLGILLFACFVIGMITLVNGKRKQEDSLYVKIQSEDIEQITKTESDCYIWVTSETCASCKKLKNDMLEVKKESSFLDKKVIYGIDLDSMPEGSDALLAKYGKEGVPFIVHYIDGQPKEILYEDITKDDIYHFFQEKDSKQKLELVYFYSPTCSSCKKISDYLLAYSKTQKNLKILKYNIVSVENKSLLNGYCEEYGVEPEFVGTVPIIFVRNSYFYEEASIKKNLEDVVEDESLGETKQVGEQVSYLNQDQKVVRDMDVLKLVGAAFLNGLNPCSLSMFFFLLMLLEADSKKVLPVGIAFCIGKFISMLLLGTVLYQVMSQIHSSILVKVIHIVLSLLLLLLGVLNLNDYAAIKKDDLGGIKAQLPEKVRGINHRLIKENVKRFLNSKYFVLSGLILGAVIGFTEFLCAGQIYLLSIVTIIQADAAYFLQAFWYLSLYSFICMLPLLFFVFLVSFGKKTSVLALFVSEKTHWVKLTYAVLFLVAGIMMLLQQFAG